LAASVAMPAALAAVQPSTFFYGYEQRNFNQHFFKTIKHQQHYKIKQWVRNTAAAATNTLII
jgi:hypothetical protein